MLDWAAKHGLDREEFREAYNSEAVLKVLKNNEQVQADMPELDMVPAFVVNGRFTTDLEMSGWHMLDVVDELIDKSKDFKTNTLAGRE